MKKIDFDLGAILMFIFNARELNGEEKLKLYDKIAALAEFSQNAIIAEMNSVEYKDHLIDILNRD